MSLADGTSDDKAVSLGMHRSCAPSVYSSVEYQNTNVVLAASVW